MSIDIGRSRSPDQIDECGYPDVQEIVYGMGEMLEASSLLAWWDMMGVMLNLYWVGHPFSGV